MSNEEFLPKMELKLLEEVREYGKSRSIEELADILEVIYRISELKGTRRDKLEQIRKRKKAQRGGFGKNLFLLSTDGK